MVCFGILTYGVYLAAVAVAGFGIWFGLFSGPAPVGLTLVPAALATAVILIALSMLFVNQPSTEFLQRRAERSTGRASKWWHHAAAAPHSLHAGLLGALDDGQAARSVAPGHTGLLGLRHRCAMGVLPRLRRLADRRRARPWLYLGTAGNLLPLPGGVGGVKAGMIGSFVGFRVRASLATLAVLGYRTISYWLPTVPGAVAYMRLRRTAGTPHRKSSNRKLPARRHTRHDQHGADP